jgi:hypothetical protein
MEITYDTIIKHLCVKKNNFETKKYIHINSNTFPKKFADIFSDKFHRYGITVNDENNNNISFWSSLLTLIDKKFIIPYTDNEIYMINQFKTQLIDSYNKSKLADFNKHFDKNDIRERFKLEPDIHVIQYIIDILDINCWIFDFKTDDINVVYPDDILNPWKQSILLANYNTIYEPIMEIEAKGDIKKLFNYNDTYFKKILNTNDIKYLNHDIINKKFEFTTDINKIIEREKINLIMSKKNKMNASIELLTSDNTIVISNDNSNSLFIKQEELDLIKTLNKTKMNKMKNAELMEVIIKLNIKLAKKNLTKANMIELIINKISLQE